MTWYELTLRRYDTNPATGAQDGGKTMSHVESDDEQVIASVMRAAADRLDPPKPPRPAYRDRPGVTRGWTSTSGPLRDANGLPNYAHDADCNTNHDAGPEACPPPVTIGAWRVRRPGRTVETDLDRAAKNDGCGPTHTYTGACALAVVERDGKAPGTTFTPS